MTITIWHNPRCSKSRETLALLQKKGVEPTIREYLKEPPSKAEVSKLIDLLDGNPQDLIRDGEPEFKALGKKKADLGKAEIVRDQDGRHRLAPGQPPSPPIRSCCSDLSWSPARARRSAGRQKLCCRY